MACCYTAAAAAGQFGRRRRRRRRRRRWWDGRRGSRVGGIKVGGNRGKRVMRWTGYPPRARRRRCRHSLPHRYGRRWQRITRSRADARKKRGHVLHPADSLRYDKIIKYDLFIMKYSILLLVVMLLVRRTSRIGNGNFCVTDIMKYPPTLVA